MKYDNPAARLLLILEAGKAAPGTRACREVWQELLGISGSTHELTARLGKVMQLPTLAVEELRASYPLQDDTWTYWESQVSSAFMVQNVHATWDTFINNIDGHTMTYLKLAAELLQAKSERRLLDGEKLSTTRSTLNGLIEEILASDEPSDVKAHVCRGLRRVVEAIDEYQLTGALPFIDAIEATLGHAAFDKRYHSFLTDSALGKRTLETLSAAANTVTVFVGIPQLTLAIAQLTG